MSRPVTLGSGQTWLTLGQASQVLGVHPTTLRSWVDSGIVRAYLTPGGHRRFLTKELRDFIEHCRASAASALSTPAADQTLLRIRRQVVSGPIDAQPWYKRLPTGQRDRHRETGRRLLGLLLQFVSRRENAEQVLEEGRRLAREYGIEFAAAESSLAELARAFLFFRRVIVNAACCPSGASAPNDAESMHLVQRINLFMDELLIATLEAFDSFGQSLPSALPDESISARSSVP